MKNKFILLTTLLLTFSGITFASPTYENAESLIQKMWDSFIDGDIDAFSQTMSKDEDMVTFGTDASERWDSWQELEDSVALQFDAFDVISVERKNKSLKISIQAILHGFLKLSIGSFYQMAILNQLKTYDIPE